MKPANALYRALLSLKKTACYLVHPLRGHARAVEEQAHAEDGGDDETDEAPDEDAASAADDELTEGGEHGALASVPGAPR